MNINTLLLIAVTLASTALADARSSIKITGRSEVLVTQAQIRLAHVADIESPLIQDDEAMVQLRTVVVGTAPRFGETVRIDGTTILERLKSQGVKLDSIRYTLPRQISVTRAYRELGLPELERAVMSYLEKKEQPVELRKLIPTQALRVPADTTNVEVMEVAVTHPGHIGVDFKAASESEEVRFRLQGIADEWRMMPVAAVALQKGQVVSASDVELKRVNGTAAGRDAVENIGDVVGHSVTRDLGQGEMFRSNNLIVPPVVRAGSRVTLLYNHDGIEATATGIAIESGITNQEIKIRNEVSKRIVVGKVVEEGFVSVSAN